MRKLFSSLLLGFTIFSAVAQTEQVDAVMIEKIKKEGLQNSKVMDIAFQLTDMSGPRLTISAGFNRAAQYAQKQLSQWGLSNAVIEPWGEFGKGWDLEKSYMALTSPYYKPLIAFPKVWCKGTNGLQQAEVIVVELKDSTSADLYRGKLKNKIIILDRSDVYKQSFAADAQRFTDDELQKMNDAAPPSINNQQRNFSTQGRRIQGPATWLNTLKQYALKEGAVAILSMNPRGHDGTVFVQGGGSYQTNAPDNLLDMMLTLEDYMSILRIAKQGKVVLETEVKTKFHTADTKGYNVIAEIKGTDPTLKEELVMLGGHLDSWHGATGATDNAAGCAVMMEAVRILQAVGAKPKRTIRIALWSGEEQGLLGSRAYVKKHFADPMTMQLTPAHQKLSAYYNLDNGTGKIRGIYLQGNEACRSIFQQWLTPFHDLGAKTVTINNTGGTDHLAFDAVGLPGFQFIQDEIEYDTRTHHTNMDSYDHLIEEDLKISATIVAAFVYNTAIRAEKLPRKPLPQARN